MLRFKVAGDLVVVIAPYEAGKPYPVAAKREDDGRRIGSTEKSLDTPSVRRYAWALSPDFSQTGDVR